TGAITSLQRQLEIKESQLRGIRSEKEMLQRQLREREEQLREREEQLQAMSDKFYSLTEEQRQQETTAKMEEENHSLQQVVTEQESQLAEQNKLISELQETISQLRAELGMSRLHILEQKQAQKELQSQAEALQHTELQTRVALERISSKFERYRSRILQATFSGEGSQGPPAPLTDEELLEALQRVVNERTEFYQLLKHRGIK
ncbi:CCD27 protein, partial [Smithornis capensis]|nr:CCD27 protein [Smithornis capensis]